MGVQGCGKGTQAKLLAEKLDLVHISVGEMFRWNIENHTKLAARVHEYLDAGRLVADELVADVIKQRLEMHDWNYGFILDGFPRNIGQAQFLMENYNVDKVVHIVIPDGLVHKRVLNRRICSKCGLDYNLMFHRPKKVTKCDICDGTLKKRTDDEPQQLERRLEEYHSKTKPVFEIFKHRKMFHEVDGTASFEGVHKEICRKLKV